MIRPTVVLAGGGTGGHVFPAVAVAEAMHALADVDVVFCGTPRGLEARVVPRRGWRIEMLDVEPIQGGGLGRVVRGGVLAASATAKALGLVRALRPRVVLSVGGYAAGPASLAAVLLGVPIAVLEANQVVGLANRILAPFAARAYVVWDEAAARFRPSARRVVGLPLRPGFGPRAYIPSAVVARVLVMGGSQGAACLNERLPEALARLRDIPGLQVLHQAGRDQDVAVREAYRRERVDRVEVVPFIDDVARALQDADLVVARAGAATLAEITAVGRAAVLVPFPHAADDHQARNAEALARAGAAVCLRQDVADPGRLAADMGRLLRDATVRTAMADSSRGLGRPRAAHDVAADLLDLAGIPHASCSGTNSGIRWSAPASEAS